MSDNNTKHNQNEIEDLRIRATQKSDLEFILNSENDADNEPFIVNWTQEKHESCFADPDVEHLVFEAERSGKQVPIGFAILRGLATEGGPIELKRIVVTEKGKGFGRKSLQFLKDLVFKEYLRNRFWLNVCPDNLRAKSLYQALGFRYEGTWRESFLTANGWESLELMATIASDERADQIFKLDNQQFKVVQSLSQHHLQDLLELHQSSWFDATRTLEQVKLSVLNAEFIIGIVECESNELVGFARVISDRGYRAWVYDVMTKKEFQGIGIGTKTIDLILEAPQLRGVARVVLDCNPEMIPYYEKWNFKVWEDQVVMRLDPTTSTCHRPS